MSSAVEIWVDIVVQILSNILFTGFGLFSIFYVLVSFWKAKISLLEVLDFKAVRFVIFLGIIYFAFTLIAAVGSFTIWGDSQSGGQFWWMRWLQPLGWVLLTQLFWIKKIREIKVLRLIIALLLVISFEHYVIVVSSFHSRPLPEAWALFSEIELLPMVWGLTKKVVLFCALAVGYAYVADRAASYFGWHKPPEDDFLP